MKTQHAKKERYIGHLKTQNSTRWSSISTKKSAEVSFQGGRERTRWADQRRKYLHLSHETKKKVNNKERSNKRSQSTSTSIGIPPRLDIFHWSQFLKLKQHKKSSFKKKKLYIHHLQRGRAERMQMNSRWMGNFYDRIDLYICSKGEKERRKKWFKTSVTNIHTQ